MKNLLIQWETEEETNRSFNDNLLTLDKKLKKKTKREIDW